jgi:hypothetical protein
MHMRSERAAHLFCWMLDRSEQEEENVHDEHARHQALVRRSPALHRLLARLQHESTVVRALGRQPVGAARL